MSRCYSEIMSTSQLYTQPDNTRLTTDLPAGSESAYTLTLRDLPDEQKPREKLIAHGPEVLTPGELLAVVLSVGTKKEDVLSMSNRILREYGSTILASERNVKRLMDELNMPETKACQVVACFELGRRFFEANPGRGQVLRTPAQVHAYLADMATLSKEHLRGLYLNNHYQLIHDEVISIGSVTANIVHPREVYRPALEYNASAVILAHNHPSGHSDPSEADKTITTQLQQAGEVMGIELLDHVIISRDGYHSLLT